MNSLSISNPQSALSLHKVIPVRNVPSCAIDEKLVTLLLLLLLLLLREKVLESSSPSLITLLPRVVAVPIVISKLASATVEIFVVIAVPLLALLLLLLKSTAPTSGVDTSAPVPSRITKSVVVVASVVPPEALPRVTITLVAAESTVKLTWRTASLHVDLFRREKQKTFALLLVLRIVEIVWLLLPTVGAVAEGLNILRLTAFPALFIVEIVEILRLIVVPTSGVEGWTLRLPVVETIFLEATVHMFLSHRKVLERLLLDFLEGHGRRWLHVERRRNAKVWHRSETWRFPYRQRNNRSSRR
uniref:(northern house mosquito) hypothetical protein n=1 Tax=Culex pipiens TaxID=7175 RepID=A0A8D8HEC3_CULPI